jgi:hypothetical protein
MKDQAFAPRPKHSRNVIKFWWLLPGIYVFVVIVLTIGMVSGAGHTPRALDFLFYILVPPCFAVDRLLPRAAAPSVLFNALVRLAAGLLMYSAAGALIDIGIKRYGRRKTTQATDSRIECDSHTHSQTCFRALETVRASKKGDPKKMNDSRHH